jgi:hypothetical protein
MIGFTYNDGGRAAAGFKGTAGDCVVRAVAIATSKPYREVYDALSEGSRNQRVTKRTKRHASARNGVSVRRKWFSDYMTSLGWEWVPTMAIGQGCKVHLRADELPVGRIICSLSGHYAAVIDGMVHDLYDPSLEGTRCVYGYWRKAGE